MWLLWLPLKFHQKFADMIVKIDGMEKWFGPFCWPERAIDMERMEVAVQRVCKEQHRRGKSPHFHPFLLTNVLA